MLKKVNPTLHCCLIVDDDPIFVTMLEQVLINHGMEIVHVARNGAQALDKLNQHIDEIQCITLDLNMGNGDGMGFLTAASKLNYYGEIILSSGEQKNILDSAMQLASMLQLNCRESFAKPVDFEALANKVMNVGAPSVPISFGESDHGAIDDALNNLRIEPRYQARVNLNNLEITGAEILARFLDEKGNILNTQNVIDRAERKGIIADLTWKMLEHLVEDTKILNSIQSNPPILSFNVNGLLLASPGFSADLVSFIKQAGINPNQIVLEVTETGLPPEPAAALEAFTRLRMHGFNIAIDDFGTGYSNIENLKLFPFTELKIDKNFVSNARNDPFSRECVATSVRLANELQLNIVAEGIETQEDLDLMRSYGIGEAQGYLFSRAVPINEFAILFSDGL